MHTAVMRTALLIALIVPSAMASGIQQVSADNCSTEQTIFQSGPMNVYGTQSEIRNTNRPLDTYCGSYTYLAWSTAHFALGNTFGNQVETGWEEELDSLNSHIFYAFTEYFTGGHLIFRNEFAFPCNWSINNYSRWKDNSSGVGSWTFYVDCEDGTGQHALTTYNHTGYNWGQAFGETGRYGTGTQPTGMSDLQQILQYRDLNGYWWNWTSNACYVNNPQDWHSQVLTGNSYQVIPGAPLC